MPAFPVLSMTLRALHPWPPLPGAQCQGGNCDNATPQRFTASSGQPLDGRGCGATDSSSVIAGSVSALLVVLDHAATEDQPVGYDDRVEEAEYEQADREFFTKSL